MKKMSIEVRGKKETWELSPYYCPSCGYGAYVWREASPGDFYVGPTHFCLRCDSVFCLAGGITKPTLEYEKDQLNKLKAGKAYVPEAAYDERPLSSRGC